MYTCVAGELCDVLRCVLFYIFEGSVVQRETCFWRPGMACGNRRVEVHRVLIQALAVVLAPLLVLCVTSEKLLSCLSPNFLLALFLACLRGVILMSRFDNNFCY